MRRRLATVLALVLGCVLLVGTPGCGGFPDAAKQYLLEGDSILFKVQPEAEDLLYELDGFFTDYAAGINSEPYGVDLKIKEFGPAARDIAERAGQARMVYEKAAGVKGAGACEAYVRQRLEAVSQIERMPGVAEGGFSTIGKLGSGDLPAADSGLEKALYTASRKLIQINIEMRYAMGSADSMAAKLGLRPSRKLSIQPRHLGRAVTLVPMLLARLHFQACRI